MLDKPTPNSARTPADVIQERGDNYPRKDGDSVKNKKDRRDFLVAAYDIITKRDTGTLMRILKMSPTNRIAIIKNFSPKTGQLKLEGMFKKILSFDQGDRITAVGSDDIVRILLEMREIFDPEAVLPRDFLPPPAPTKKVAQAVAPRVIGILNRPPTRPTSASKKISTSSVNAERAKTDSDGRSASFIDPIKNEGPKNNSGEEVHIPAFLKNRRVPRVTPMPKRESPKPTYEISEPIVAPKQTERPKFQTVVVQRPIIATLPEEIPEVTEPTPMNVTFPESLGYEESLEWLRNEPSVQVGLDAAQKIQAFKRDDLSIMALFHREYPVLYTAFTRLRKLSNHSCLDIIHDVHNPDPLLILKKDPEVVQKVRVCFEHHKRGEYEEFTQALKEISHDANIA